MELKAFPNTHDLIWFDLTIQTYSRDNVSSVPINAGIDTLSQ